MSMTFDFAAAIADIPDATEPVDYEVQINAITYHYDDLEAARSLYGDHYEEASLTELRVDGRVVLSCRPKGASHV